MALLPSLRPACIVAVTALVACERTPSSAPADTPDVVTVVDVPQDLPEPVDVSARAVGVYERAVASRRVRVTVYEPSIVRVQYHRERPHPDRGWTALPIPPPTGALPTVTEGDEDIARTGALTLRIHRVSGNVTALDASGRAHAFSWIISS